VSEAVKSLLAIAAERRKPLVIEKLDFRKKKAALEKEDRRYARMLSYFAYRLIHTVIAARAFDAGIELLQETPAYPSVIGREKFAGRYGCLGIMPRLWFWVEEYMALVNGCRVSFRSPFLSL
jgi:IS605 OrfB family transposase